MKPSLTSKMAPGPFLLPTMNFTDHLGELDPVDVQAKNQACTTGN